MYIYIFNVYIFIIATHGPSSLKLYNFYYNCLLELIQFIYVPLVFSFKFYKSYYIIFELYIYNKIIYQLIFIKTKLTLTLRMHMHAQLIIIIIMYTYN